MDPKDTQPCVSRVPLEIWRHIILRLDLPSSSYSDLALLWINLRGVSSFFQAEIEALFEKMILPDMKIDIWLKPDLESKVRQDASSDFNAVFNDRLDVPKPSSTLQRRIRCAFFQICKVNGSATFHPDLERPIKEKRTLVLDRAFTMLEELCRPHVEGPFAQHYMLQIAGVHNNLVIPEMRVRTRDWEICFDWRKLFSKLFSEEKVAVEFTKLPEEATKEMLQRERQYHFYSSAGDFRSHLRTKRFRKWYDHQCSYIANGMPESDYFDTGKVAQRLLENGLKEYHNRFDRGRLPGPVMPWNLRQHNMVLAEDTDGDSSDGDSSDDYDFSDDHDDPGYYDYGPSVDGEDDDDDLRFLSTPGSLISPDEDDNDHRSGLPSADDVVTRNGAAEKNDNDAASEANNLEHSMPEDSSD